jgi:hypothetical protein
MMCAGWIRFRASLTAMRRTSWIDQRINDGLELLWILLRFDVEFFLAAANWPDGGSPPSWRRRASQAKRGDSTHARICSRCDRVRTRFSRSQNCPRLPTDGLRSPLAFPETVICAVKFFNLEIGQFEIAPIMQPRSFGSSPCRQAFPLGRGSRLGNLPGRAGNRSPFAPGSKYMSAADAEYIAFACAT